MPKGVAATRSPPLSLQLSGILLEGSGRGARGARTHFIVKSTEAYWKVNYQGDGGEGTRATVAPCCKGGRGKVSPQGRPPGQSFRVSSLSQDFMTVPKAPSPGRGMTFL